MTPELHNRIRNELKEIMGREPYENEVINSQNDPVIMYRVDKRINDEEKYNMQLQIEDLQTQLDGVSTSVDSLQAKPVR